MSNYFEHLLPPPRRICNRRCLFVCLSVCLLATLRKNFKTDLHEMCREGWQWISKQMIKFWWRSRSGIRIWICIATLVRRALAEVCTLPVLLIIIRPHRRSTYVDAAYCYRPSSVVCRSVGWSVCHSSEPYKKRLNRSRCRLV